jgi:hypothetical protein
VIRRFVPSATERIAANLCLLDHLVGEREQLVRNLEAERLGGFQIDYQVVLGRQLHWQITRLFPA